MILEEHFAGHQGADLFEFDKIKPRWAETSSLPPQGSHGHGKVMEFETWIPKVIGFRKMCYDHGKVTEFQIFISFISGWYIGKFRSFVQNINIFGQVKMWSLTWSLVQWLFLEGAYGWVSPGSHYFLLYNSSNLGVMELCIHVSEWTVFVEAKHSMAPRCSYASFLCALSAHEIADDFSRIFKVLKSKQLNEVMAIIADGLVGAQLDWLRAGISSE